jgi:hypothetical protein
MKMEPAGGAAHGGPRRAERTAKPRERWADGDTPMGELTQAGASTVGLGAETGPAGSIEER